MRFAVQVVVFFHILHYVLHLEYVMGVRMEYVINEKVEYVIRGVEYVINRKVEYVMEYVIIVEIQNPWSMVKSCRNFHMASNVSFGCI